MGDYAVCECTQCRGKNVLIARRTLQLHAAHDREAVALQRRRAREQAAQRQQQHDDTAVHVDSDDDFDMTNLGLSDYEDNTEEEEGEEDDDGDGGGGDGSDGDDSSDGGDGVDDPHRVMPLVRWFCKLLLKYKIRFKSSNKSFETMLSLMRALVMELPLQREYAQQLFLHLPRSLRQTRRSAGVAAQAEHDGDAKQFVLCSGCGVLHDPDPLAAPGQLCGAQAHRVQRPCERALYVERRHVLRPVLEATYCPLKSWLCRLLVRSDVFDQVMESLKVEPQSRRYDLWNGSVWVDFAERAREWLKQNVVSLGLVFGYDGFSKHGHFGGPGLSGCGACMVFLGNLRPQARTKMGNIHIPFIAAKEEKHVLTSFLRPVAEELKELHDGFVISLDGTVIKFRVELLEWSADLPARAKTTGQLSHAATLGCGRCWVKSETCIDEENKRHFAGEGDVRKPNEVNALVAKLRAAHGTNNLTTYSSLVSKSGLRPSPLNDVPGLELPTCAPCDPMHNLLLGVLPALFTLATETWGRDKPAQLVERLKQVDRSIPSSLRIAKKYLVKMDKWSGMRAIDYHTLATVHGRLCLGSLVTDQKFVNFARLCGIISTVFAPSLTDNDLKLLPGRIACFQNEFIRLYGKEKVTINVHSMRHIPVDLTRYGTGLWASAFWIEKSIGVLKAFTTSQRSTLQAEVHLAHQDMATLNGRPLPRLHQNRDTLIDKDTSDPEFGVDARRLQNLARSSVEPSDPLLVVGQELIDKVCQAANVQVLVAHLGDDPSWPVTLHHNQTMLPVPVPIVQYTKALYPETDLPYVTSKGWRYAKCQVNSLNLHSRLYRRHDQKQPCYIKAVVDTDARDRSRRFYVAEVKAFWEVTCWHGPDQGRKQTVHHLAEVEWLQTVANPLAGHGLNLTDLRGVCAVDLNPAGTRNDHPSELEHSPVLVRAIVARLAKGPEGMFGRDQEQGENVDGMAEPPTPQSKRPRLAAAATTDARGPADTQLTSWRRTRTPTPKVRENQQRAAAAAAAAASSSRVGRAPSISRAPRLFAGTPTTCIFVDIQELHVNVVRSGRST